MPLAARMDKHRNAEGGEVARASCVVEMNVGDQQRLEIARFEADLSQLRANAGERNRATALDENRAIASAHHKRQGRLRRAEIHRVKRTVGQ